MIAVLAVEANVETVDLHPVALGRVNLGLFDFSDEAGLHERELPPWDVPKTQPAAPCDAAVTADGHD
jgi:hypothetical protein